MTILLLIITVALFLSFQWYLGHRRQRMAEVARAREVIPFERTRSASPPPDLLFHPGHTWVRIHDAKLASIGVTDFAANFVGRLSKIELPEEGDRRDQAEPGWTLVSSRNRRLEQPLPIGGTILAVNRELLDNPELAQRAPYEAGWILRVRPRHLRDALRNLLPGTAAPLWMDAARARVVSHLSPALGAVALDGGEWVPGFGDRLTEQDWHTLKRELFPTDQRRNNESR